MTGAQEQCSENDMCGVRAGMGRERGDARCTRVRASGVAAQLPFAPLALCLLFFPSQTCRALYVRHILHERGRGWQGAIFVGGGGGATFFGAPCVPCVPPQQEGTRAFLSLSLSELYGVTMDDVGSRDGLG